MATAKTKNNSSAANLGFEAKLWLAADKLRSNMDAAEYKHVVLGLIFLKYISVAFKEMHARLIAGQGDYAGADPEDAERATSEEYKQIRKEHPAIERKLNELVRWHDGRHVRYRGLARVKVQYLLLGVVVNCKRMVRLLTPAPTAQPA